MLHISDEINVSITGVVGCDLISARAIVMVGLANTTRVNEGDRQRDTERKKEREKLHFKSHIKEI